MSLRSLAGLFRRRPPAALRRAMLIAGWAAEWTPPEMVACVVAVEHPFAPAGTPRRVTVHMHSCCVHARVPLDGERFPSRASVLAELDRAAYRLHEMNERAHAAQQIRALVVARDDAPPLDIGEIAITLPGGKRPIDCGGEGKGGEHAR